MKTFTYIATILCVSLSLFANEKRQAEDFQTFFRNFQENTKKTYQKIPHKSEELRRPKFKESAIESKNFILYKSFGEQHYRPVTKTIKAEYDNANQASSLVDNKESMISNILEFQKQGLLQAKLETQPWSDDYWPIARGMIASRYGDYFNRHTYEWEDQYEYVKENPVSELIERKEFDFLSPAEKYDLLVGDENFSLTNSMWMGGKRYFDEYGSVETWMGLCHGWAQASYMLARPGKKTSVLSYESKIPLNFYPADIKALATLLWANGKVPSKFVGSRCNEKEPEIDEDTGRVIDPKCFDINPGTWHLSIVNQIGKSKRSFVMDATFDYEVWNQPILSYSYNYFNPNSGTTSDDASQSMVKIENFSQDQFKKYRSKKTAFVVGIEMEVAYMAETAPAQTEFDSKDNDFISEVTYRYDLEIDSNFKIIGGEWYSSAHPDFLWTPKKDAKALSVADKFLIQRGIHLEWEKGQVIPETWHKVAPYASKDSGGMPLAFIVDELIKRSNSSRVTKE